MPREFLRKISRLVRYRKIEAALRRLLLEPIRGASRRRAYRRMVARAVGGATPPVLVYAMPKVASTAAAEALRSVEGVSVFQVHLISEASIRRLRRYASARPRRTRTRRGRHRRPRSRARREAH